MEPVHPAADMPPSISQSRAGKRWREIALSDPESEIRGDNDEVESEKSLRGCAWPSPHVLAPPNKKLNSSDARGNNPRRPAPGTSCKADEWGTHPERIELCEQAAEHCAPAAHPADARLDIASGASESTVGHRGTQAAGQPREREQPRE